MKGWLRRSLEISLLVLTAWISMLILILFIELVVIRVYFENSLIRGIFRVGLSGLLILLWLMFWWRLTVWYYKRRVLGK
ncbi:MAG: hypothetical protein DRN15_00570 [Thermoprotei archaeon]|nr:MAG: hypothetical protein DRM97_03150 [Thermoprotei archaeon]RLF25183.1 MAG: hypothetical protein DRN15_00570 [Thermoprotei archaeon]